MARTSAIGRPASRGFTLIELLVVLAIVALLAAAFPFALNRTLPARRVAATTQAIVVAINDARAASAVCSCAVRVELHGRELTVSTASGHRQLPRSKPVSIPSSTVVSLTDADGRAVEAFNVYPDGSSQSAQFEISDGRRRSTVSVSEITGRIRMARVQ